MKNYHWFKKGVAFCLLGALAVVFGGCGADSGSETKTVKIGVTGAVYEELWQPAKEMLAEEGINIEIVQFSDFATPNNALNSGDIDLNAFQHVLYLNDEVKQNDYQIAPIGYTFIIPLNLYSDKVETVDEIKAGDTVAIPNDVTNGGRALKVLEAAGLIRLDEAAGDSPTIDDIVEYHTAITIKELAANTIPSVLSDVTAAVINGPYALDYDLDPETALFKDQALDNQDYWNIIAARAQDLKDTETAALYQKIVDAFHGEATRTVFETSFNGYFVPVGWDADLLNR